ncbi:MAG: TolC family protein [SAR324 cluster bacterium]|nr:TolC family protein [SAR324 cluster bacterium]
MTTFQVTAHTIKSSHLHLRLIVLLALLFLFAGKLHAIDIDPELLKKFSLVEENGEIIVEVSMEGLLSLALERSTTVEVLKINRQIAEEALAATRGSYNPVFKTSVGVSHAVSPAGTNLSGNVYGIGASSTTPPIGFVPSPYLSLSATDNIALSASWSKKDRSGISYQLMYQKISNKTSFSSLANEGDTFESWTGLDDPLYIDHLSAAVNIPIFQDWGDINRFPEFKSEIALSQTEMQSKKSKLELLKIIAHIYWDLVGVQQSIQTLNSSIKLAEQFLEDTQIRQKLGVLDVIEVKQSQSSLAIVRQSHLQEVFKKNQIEDQIRAALNLGDLPYGYKGTEKMVVRKDIPDFKSLLDKVYAANMDIQLLKAAERMNDLVMKEAENRADTNLDLNILYQLNGYGKDYTTAVAGMSETNLHDYQIGISWQIPLFDKVTPQKINQAVLERARLNLQIINQKSFLKVELQSIFRNLKLAVQGIKLAQNTVELVGELLRKETEKFNLGNNTSFRISQVQQDLTDARKNEILARTQYEKVYLSLLLITEDIFPAYHLKD